MTSLHVESIPRVANRHAFSFCRPQCDDNRRPPALVLILHDDIDEELHATPTSGSIRGAAQDEQTIACGQEDWKILQVCCDVRLVDASFIKPQARRTAVSAAKVFIAIT
jgi:hypothetical protein